MRLGKQTLTHSEGVLVECDPSIKAIITRINEQRNHEIIVEDIDDEHVLIKKDKHEELKFLLKEVRTPVAPPVRVVADSSFYRHSRTPSRKLKRARSPSNGYVQPIIWTGKFCGQNDQCPQGLKHHPAMTRMSLHLASTQLLSKPSATAHNLI